MQGEKMIDPQLPRFVPTELTVKAAASCLVSQEELNLPQGKSIAELLYEEKEKNNQDQAQDQEETGQSQTN
jgi:hypothetical protein